MSKAPTPEVSALFIDKISLTGNPVQEADAFRRHAADVIADWKKQNRVKEIPKRHGDRYKVKYMLVDGADELCLIQIDAVDSTHSMFRLEFNPAKLSDRGRKRLRQHLTDLFLADFDEVMAAVKITTMDSAVDISHVNFATLVVTENKKRKSGAWGKNLGGNGQIETFYLGSKRSDEQVKVYNKKEQLKSTGRDPGQEITRVEVTQIPKPKDKKTGRLGHGIHLTELHLLRNPFARIQLSSLPAARKYSDSDRWTMFLGCCESRGVQGALSGIGDDKLRRIYLKRVIRGAFSWWNPDAIWKGLPLALRNVGIFPESAFEKRMVDEKQEAVFTRVSASEILKSAVEDEDEDDE